jgi:hypothetical protein
MIRDRRQAYERGDVKRGSYMEPGDAVASRSNTGVLNPIVAGEAP